MKKAINFKSIFIFTLLVNVISLPIFAQYEVKTGRLYNSPIRSHSFHLYLFASGCENGAVNIWITELTKAKNKVLAMSFNPTGGYLASSNFNEIDVWKIEEKNKLAKKFTGAKDSIRCIAFSSNGEFIAACSDDKNVYVWNFKENKLIAVLSGHSRRVNSVCFSPNGLCLASGSADSTVKTWNLRETKVLKTFKGHGDIVNSVSYSPDGLFLASGSSDNTIKIWDVNTGKVTKSLIGHNGKINSVVFHPSGLFLASGSDDKTVNVWHVKRNKIIYSLKEHMKSVTYVGYLKDYETDKVFLVSCGLDGRLIIRTEISLPPSYDILINQMAESKLSEWEKKGIYEKTVDYEKRLTELRASKMSEFIQEATNYYALQTVALSNPKKEQYDADNETFTLTFKDLNPIKLNVSNTNAEYFDKNYKSCVFKNPVFSINEDVFSLAQLEIKDTINNKAYYYGKEDPEAVRLRNEVALKKIEIVPTTVVLEVKNYEDTLKKQLAQYIDDLHSSKRMTDNVSTNVSTKAVIEKDSVGNNEINFHVEYSYEVIKASVDNQTDDFPAGKYKLTQSNAAKATLQILQETLETKLVSYLKTGTKVTIKITGSTDATPIGGKIPYGGEYGDFDDEPCFINGNLSSININKTEGIKENFQLAFLRTYGVRQILETYAEPLKKTKNSFQHFAVVSKEKGSQFRRISIELIIHGVFNEYKQKKTVLSDVDLNIPQVAYTNPNRFALIIGNEDYSNFQTDIKAESDALFAKNDAETFREYCTKTLGIPAQNITFQNNATSAQMRRLLKKLTTIAEIKKGEAELIFYYSGHGLPDESTQTPYLLPVDISGSDIKSGICLDTICKQLNQYPCKRVTMFLDACFSGGARNQSMLSLKGVKVKPKESILSGNLIMFSSSSGDESSTIYKDRFHGIFTYYLLKKLQETKGEVSYQELSDYIYQNVTLESININNQKQTPQILGSPQIQNEWINWHLNDK
ncbi:MAG: caspase family protein [Bacteroidales bacterium]|nr:caspase family protein [Bacteroidales bacterium]